MVGKSMRITEAVVIWTPAWADSRNAGSLRVERRGSMRKPARIIQEGNPQVEEGISLAGTWNAPLLESS
jgi:hypothetical protein